MLANGWSTPISSIIRDDFVVGDAWTTAHLTLDDAVSHRTGMALHDLAWQRSKNGTNVAIADVVQNLRHFKPLAEPRAKWQYCNQMYVALSHVIETLTGKWLGHTIEELIFKPLNMTASFGDTHEAIGAPEYLATGYYWNGETDLHQEVPADSTRESSGAGMLISNVVDYAKWMMCLLHETKPFSKAAHRDIRSTRMLGPQEERSGPGDTVYGLGWHRKISHNAIVYYHGGTVLAYGTEFYWLPEHNFGVITMANAAVPGMLPGNVSCGD